MISFSNVCLVLMPECRAQIFPSRDTIAAHGSAVVETNGAEARWSAASPGECSAVGADETVTVWVPIGQPTPLSNVGFTACLRGPGLAASEAAVRALLASARLGQ